MKRILVSGGAGFIGHHLCRKLLEMGDIVDCIDDLSTGRLENINFNQKLNPFGFFRHDITEPFTWEDWGFIDEIYHLACPASPVAYQKDPVKTMLTCIVGTKNVLDLAKATGAKVLLTSTSEVYGDPIEHPQKEEYFGNVNSLGSRACYDNGKRGAETLMMDYHRMCGVDTRIARIFNTYGTGMQADDGRVVSNFINQALKGDRLTFYGKGTQTRSFCYVDDTVDGLIALMGSGYNLPVNIGNPDEHPVWKLGEKILAFTGSNSSIDFLPLPADDPKVRRPDITRAKELLGWEPQVSLDDGLKRTIEYFKDELDKYKVIPNPFYKNVPLVKIESVA